MHCLLLGSRTRQEFAKAQKITVPALSGEWEILPGHAEAFIVLGVGEVHIDENPVKISGGVAHVKNDQVAIMLS